MAATGIFLTAVIFTVATVHCSSFPTTLTLERGISPSHDLAQLRELDRSRHSRTLLANHSGDIFFSLQGQYQPPVMGIYYTRLRIGSPPKDYFVQIDTGSNVVWVSCVSCMGCPAKSDLGTTVNYYDPGTSTTSGLLPCWNNMCRAGSQSSDSFCSTRTSLCGFQLQYPDGNAYGYYVADLLHVYAASDPDMKNAISSPLVFGCATMLTGNKTKSHKVVGGMLGLGPRNLSLISQLASQGVTPRAFSHCLRGDEIGGGLLVLGEVHIPRMVYTTLVQSTSQYKLDLQSIAVAGKTLAIDESVFKTTDTQGTVVDSGTTLAYLADGAYDPVIEAISEFALRNAISYPNNMYKCFLVGGSIDKLFPKVSLNFADDSTMVLYPKDYLVKQSSLAGDVWCIGFERVTGQQITILGDLVLKDKIIVYDMEKQRFGWTDYDCAVAANSSVNNGNSQKGATSKSSERNVPYEVVLMMIIMLLMHMIPSSSYLFL